MVELRNQPGIACRRRARALGMFLAPDAIAAQSGFLKIFGALVHRNRQYSVAESAPAASSVDRLSPQRAAGTDCPLDRIVAEDGKPFNRNGFRMFRRLARYLQFQERKQTAYQRFRHVKKTFVFLFSTFLAGT